MTTRYRTKGTSLAKGPVGLIGLALLAYGITALIFGGHGFAQHPPSGAVHGKTWLGLEVNGWSALLFVAAGLLLLLAAPMHWGAKTMSLIVGISLVVLCLIALANGHGALGIFAANGLTELVWGAAGALLIILSLLPRVGGRTRDIDGRPATRRSTRRLESESGTVERNPGTVERNPGTVERNPARERTTNVDQRRPATNGAPEGTLVPTTGGEDYDDATEPDEPR